MYLVRSILKYSFLVSTLIIFSGCISEITVDLNSENERESLTDESAALLANNITPADIPENTESIITLEYNDVEGYLANSCEVSNLSNLIVTTACSCDVTGLCTVGVTGTVSYNGPAGFDYRVTANGEDSEIASANFEVSASWHGFGGEANDVEVRGNFAYVAKGFGGLEVYDGHYPCESSFG